MPKPTTPRPSKPGPRRPAGLVALDLDGTLLAPDGHVTARTRDAVHALIAAGTHVAIATGRSWWESRGAIAEAGLVGTGIFAGGAILSDVTDGRTVWSSRMPPTLAQELCRVVHEAGLTAMVLQDRFHADAEWLIAAERDMPTSMPEWLAHHGSTFRRVEDLSTATHEWTVRISTIASRERHAELSAHLNEQFGDRIYLHDITVPSTGISIVEIFDANVNKWSGVRRLALELGVDEASVVAVGDDMNDLAMLRHAGLGVAMGNARDEVKSVVDRVIGTNAADGLAIFLEQLLVDGIDGDHRDDSDDQASDAVSGSEGS